MPYYDDTQNYYAVRQPQQQRQQPSQYPEWWPNQQQRQQPPPPSQPTVLPGRFVNADNEVYPNSIPNDGSIAVFPLTDFSAVYLKKWEPNGTITSVRYIPDVQQPGPSQEQIFQNDVQQRLQNLENMVTNLIGIWQPAETKNEEKADGKA